MFFVQIRSAEPEPAVPGSRNKEKERLMKCELRVDGSTVNSFYDRGNKQTYPSITAMLELQKNQEVVVRCSGRVQGTDGPLTSYFMGYMISAN